MSVNETQVGGSHYKSEYQHWDFATDVGLAYLPAQITKYVARWRKKNGLQDLEKALHFLNKHLEICVTRIHKENEALEIFFSANPDLGEKEKALFTAMVRSRYSSVNLLAECRAILENLIENHEDFKENRDEWKTK